MIAAGIRAVFFDVYGTLLDGTRHPDRHERMAAVAERFGVKAECRIDEAFDRAVAAAHRASGEPFPEIDVRALWRLIFPALTETDAFALEIEEAVHPVIVHEEGAEILHQAVQQGLPIGIISNAQAYTRVLLKRHFPDVWPCLRKDLMAFSYEHRIAKPDRRLFEEAIRPLIHEGLSPGEILMVGDSPTHDIQPAEALGLRTLLLPRQARRPGFPVARNNARR